MARIQLLKNLLRTTSVYPITTAEAVYDNNQKLSTVLTDIRENYAKKEQVCNPNLLDNAWFTVNQRGQSEYTHTGIETMVYSLDRWKYQEGTVTVGDEFVNFTSSGSTDLYKRFAEYLNWTFEKRPGTYTISMLAKINSVTGRVRLRACNGISGFTAEYVAGSGIILAQTEDYQIFTTTFIINENNSYTNPACVEILCEKDANIDIDIRAIKLEKGSISTLGSEMQPNYDLELYKCVTSTTDPVDTYANKPNYSELNNSLTNEDNEKFIFGVKDGVRGFYTDPSKADDSFVPFKSNIELLGKILPISLVSTRIDGGSINTCVDFIPCGDFVKINASRGNDKSLLELYGKINVSDNSYTRIWSSDISNSNINQMCNIKGYKILRIVFIDKKDIYAGVWTSSSINGSLVFS